MVRSAVVRTSAGSRARSAPPHAPSPAAYRTFSPRLAPALIAAGGVLAIIGGLGVWIQAVKVTQTGSVQHAGSIVGAGRPWGWVIASLGAAAILSSLLRLRRWQWLPIAAQSIAVAAVVCIALRIGAVSREGSAMAFRAGARAGTTFAAYHAGFGWAAWIMTLAAVVLGLGGVVGLLRWIDVRKGLAA
jgi:hypothetical protein